MAFGCVLGELAKNIKCEEKQMLVRIGTRCWEGDRSEERSFDLFGLISLLF
jgi:hypothetical protein